MTNSNLNNKNNALNNILETKQKQLKKLTIIQKGELWEIYTKGENLLLTLGYGFENKVKIGKDPINHQIDRYIFLDHKVTDYQEKTFVLDGKYLFSWYVVAGSPTFERHKLEKHSRLPETYFVKLQKKGWGNIFTEEINLLEKLAETKPKYPIKDFLLNKNKLPRKNGGYWQWNNLDFNCWHCGYDIENGTGYYDCQNIEDLEKNKTDWSKEASTERASLNLPNCKRFAYRLYCEVCSQAKGYDSDYRTSQQWRKDWDEEYLRRSKLFHAHHKYEGEKLVTLNPHLFYQGYQKWLKTQKNSSEKSKVKQFLLSHSRLLKANKIERSKMFTYRDKIFDRIIGDLRKYYERVTHGDYRYDGMPQISGGIRDWAEKKIWQLLVLIGEPNHLGYEHISNDYWAEK